MQNIISPSLWDIPEQVCTICHKPKPLANFYRHSQCKSGYMSQCKPCYRARLRDKEYVRPIYTTCVECGEDDPTKFPCKRDGTRRHTKRCRKCEYKYHKKFGLSIYEREAMIQAQSGVCAICGKPETVRHQNGILKRLSVDHNHKTGKVRGLLCANCNHLLGAAGDSITTLKNAIRYLDKHA